MHTLSSFPFAVPPCGEIFTNECHRGRCEFGNCVKPSSGVQCQCVSEGGTGMYIMDLFSFSLSIE